MRNLDRIFVLVVITLCIAYGWLVVQMFGGAP